MKGTGGRKDCKGLFKEVRKKKKEEVLLQKPLKERVTIIRKKG